MKKLFLTLVIALVAMVAQSQNVHNTKYEQRIDSLLTRIDSLIEENNRWTEQTNIDLAFKNRYKLYPTENIYTLLELDTKTGKIKQVQWSIDKSPEGTWTINDVDYGRGTGSNTFELYPTKNMYQFILIDKTDGRKWHIQWGVGDSKRWIRRIY